MTAKTSPIGISSHALCAAFAPEFSTKSIAPAENENPRWTPSALTSASEIPVMTAWNRYTGQERGQRGRDHDTADDLLLARLRGLPDGQRGRGQGEHEDREEPGGERTRVRVTVEEVGDVATVEDEPHGHVQQLVQTDRDEQPVEEAV